MNSISQGNSRAKQGFNMQSYASSTTLIYVVFFLATGLAIVYLYNFYKSIQTSVQTKITNIYADCPDYWESIGNNRCRNVNFLGSCALIPGDNIVDFSGEIFTNKNTGNYAKCKWSQGCDAPWSGIQRLC